MKTGALTSLTASFLVLAAATFVALHVTRVATPAAMPAVLAALGSPAASPASQPVVTLPAVTVRPSRADWEAAGIVAPSSGGMAGGGGGAAGPSLSMPYYSFGGRLARASKD